MTFRLMLVPFRGVRDVDLLNLVHDLDFLNLDIRLHKELDIPKEAYDPRRNQYRADVLLACARRIGEEHVLGVTDLDTYSGNLNFVFGLAECPGRAAIISLRRLRADGGEQAFRERAVKEAVHELGHTLGLQHCPDPACVMYFSNRLADTDRKGKKFCSRCLESIEGWG